MLSHMQSGGSTVRKKIIVSEMVYVSTILTDVKMDWCNTEFNGTKLDPHKQYAEMVTQIPLL